MPLKNEHYNLSSYIVNLINNMNSLEKSLGNYKVPASYALPALLFAGVVLYGLRKYGQGGQCRIKKDLASKIAVVTGGNAGIGEQTVYELAKRNCKVIFGARDIKKCERVLQKLKNINKDIECLYFPLDLSSKESVEDFSKNVKNNCEKVDYLINNAGGIMFKGRKTNELGW